MEHDSLQPGELLDGFRLEEKLFQGGMASLWRVSRDDLAIPVVMKIPRLKYGDDPAAIVGFEVEQMVMPKLAGRHIPRFVAAGDFSARPYLAMEFIPGFSLHHQATTSLIRSAEDIAIVGAKIAIALHDVHRQHVIHLDLKPSNILFRETGEAVLVDFGLAHHTLLPDLLAEEFHLPLGTGAYISPEQVLYVRNDPRSDLYALGVILYSLVTGERPFGDPTSVPGLKRRLYRAPAPPREKNPSCPRWLQEIILRCLEVDPDDRYEGAAQLAFALQNPSQVELTERAGAVSGKGFGAVFKRWLRAVELGPALVSRVSPQHDPVPIVMVSVDTAQTEALGDRLRQEVRRIFKADERARLTCVTVRKIPKVGMDLGVDEKGENLHVQRLIKLKHWAQPLGIPPEKISFHVLEAADPADATIDFAKANLVEHIIIGARGSSSLRRLLGSVSSRVVTEAPCTVTVVRLHHSQAP